MGVYVCVYVYTLTLTNKYIIHIISSSHVLQLNSAQFRKTTIRVTDCRKRQTNLLQL